MIERKVRSSTWAAAVATVALYLIGQLFTDMPDPVKAALGALIAAGATFAGGYLAPHTPRPDLEHTPRHAADDGYSAPELLVAVGAFVVLICLAVFIIRGA